MNEHVDVLSTEATNTVACNEEATNEVVEEWRPVVGYENSYEVSNYGRVRSLAYNKKNKEVAVTRYPEQAIAVLQAKVHGVKRSYYARVYVLVLEAFVRPLTEIDSVVHKNGDIYDNRLINLEVRAKPYDATVIWKPVVGWEGLYEVSNMGDVRSILPDYPYKSELKKQLKRGYFQVNLHAKSKTRWIAVHRLVAEAFIPNPENKPQIDHINTIKTDNRVENLRWVTSHENHINPITVENYRKKFSSQEYRDRKREDYYKSGAQDALEAANEERKRPVYCIELHQLFPSLKEAERKTGCFAVNIKVACERYIAGRRTVDIKNGKRVLHWRWPTPEEIAAYNEQQDQTQAE